MSSTGIGLADAIENLRRELTQAIDRGDGEKLRFNIDTIELELAVEIVKEGVGSGKVTFKVLGVGGELGAEGKLSHSNAHRICLKLKPAKSDTLVSDEVCGPPP